MNVTRIDALMFDVKFPEGLAPGAGRDGSSNLIARDGRHKPVLRGSALAGVLRHQYAKLGHDAEQYFGPSRIVSGDRKTSRLKVADVKLVTGDIEESTRHHIRVNRHSGAVAGKDYFSLSACPPGTSAQIGLWLESCGDSNSDDSGTFIKTLAEVLHAGITLGGGTARGIGRMEVDGQLRRCTFDLTDPEEYSAYLDAHEAWRRSGTFPDGMPIDVDAPEKTLTVKIKLTLPRGQDILIADGQGIEHEMEPQEITDAKGRRCWRLPGSTLRGVLRDWMTRLAARDGTKGQVFDMGRGPGADLKPVPGDEHGRAGAATLDAVTCPIARLFGTTHGKGRIHVSDALTPCHENQSQIRMHVAIDRVSGGARPAALFDNRVLISPPNNPLIFEVDIRIDDPLEHEARWLANALFALDLGLLRVGSSKAAGCLCLATSPEAVGPHCKIFTELTPSRKEL
jgi:CRISPR/Cas system CSM-associated protein Csm3 (group 7 of RAMP superfamily)